MRKGATQRTLGGICEKALQFHSALKNGMRKCLIQNSQKLDQNLKAKIFFGCINEPLIYGNDWRSIYDIVPLPELHSQVLQN